jgi:hypothetical protein
MGTQEMRSIVFCTQCGTENVESAVFCIKCGKQIAINTVEKTSEKTDTYYWALALLPVFLGLLGIVFSATLDPNIASVAALICAVAVNIALVTADSNLLKKRGIELSALLGIVLVPVYLYRRAKLTSTSQIGVLVWSGAFVVSLLVSIIGSTFIGTQVNTDATEIGIKDWLVENSITDTTVTVSCPESVLAKPGATFLCTVDTDPTITLQVKIENEQGDVTWQIIG